MRNCAVILLCVFNVVCCCVGRCYEEKINS